MSYTGYFDNLYGITTTNGTYEVMGCAWDAGGVANVFGDTTCGLNNGGEKQSIALLREFYKDRDLLILDEPTSALDVEGIKQLKRYIKKISKDKIVLIISHDSDWSNIADVTIKLNKKNEG